MATTINTDFVEKWVAALRSGEYKQGQGYLRKGVDGAAEFCCLGVACDLVIKEHLVDIQTDFGPEYTVRYDGAATHLPPSVADYLGFDARTRVPDPMARHATMNNAELALIDLNDAGNDFATIADFIEEHVLTPAKAVA